MSCNGNQHTVLCQLNFKTNKKAILHKKRSDLWSPGGGGGGRGNWMKAVKRYQLPVIRQINTREVIYMINRMNTSVCYT